MRVIVTTLPLGGDPPRIIVHEVCDVMVDEFDPGTISFVPEGSNTASLTYHFRYVAKMEIIP